MATNPYLDTINSEGILQYLLAQLSAEDAAARSQMQNAITGLRADYNGSGNPFSTVAQLGRQRSQQRGNMRADRAARGVIQSGGTALEEGEIGYNYGLQNYNALRDLMSQISGMESQYAQGARERFGQQQGYYQDAINRLQQAGFRPPGPVKRPPRPLRRNPIYNPRLGSGFSRSKSGGYGGGV